MKICSRCHRTYTDETLNFCLVDGSVLSEWSDPYKTQRISATRDTTSAPTEALDNLRGLNNQPPVLHPTIEAAQPLPVHSVTPQFGFHEKRSKRTGFLVAVAVVVGILLGVWITVSIMKSGKEAATNERLDSKASSETPTSTPNDLPGNHWRECETNVTQVCGDWNRVSGANWKGKWNSVEANLTITVNGNQVTVQRRDVTSTLEATYRGTLDSDGNMRGTVDWCCDRQGRRSGTWRAVSHDNKLNP